MLDQKPGKATPTHNHAASGPEPHAGKQSRVEQELGGQGHGGPVATAASVIDPPISTSGTISRDFSEFHQGDVLIKESVSATLSHGEGPIKIDIDRGGLSVGNEHMTLNLKSADAATGKRLQVSGASAEIIKGHTSHTGAKIEEDYVGVDYSTSWTVQGTGRNPWSVTLSFSTFVGAKPPQKHHHWWQDLPGLGELAAAITAVAGVIVASAPEWGPVVVVALA
jgi:hypothetical protein